MSRNDMISCQQKFVISVFFKLLHLLLLLTTNKHKKYHTEQTVNNKQTTYCSLNRKQYKSEVGRSESVHHCLQTRHSRSEPPQAANSADWYRSTISDSDITMTTTTVIVTTEPDNTNAVCNT